jgi:O-acetylhomoserine (thiol)-lyase
MNFETKAIHSGYESDPKTGASALPIFETASFSYPDPQVLEDVFKGRKFGHVYSRISNPTVAAFEQKVTALYDGLASVAVESGMAAVSAVVQTLVNAGEDIVSSSSLFGGSFYYFEDLKRFNITTRYFQPQDVEGFASAITPKTKLLFVECIGNPKIDVPAISELSALAVKHNIPLVVDATLTSPYLFDAKAFGAHIVVQSATKYMGLGGTTMGGVITDLGIFNWKNYAQEGIQNASKTAGQFAFVAKLRKWMLTNVGHLLSPHNAFLLMIGLETLSLRMDKHCSNALSIAQFFEKQSHIEAVNYPGLPQNPFYAAATRYYKGQYGALLTIRLGSKDRCYQFIKSLKIAKNQANLGDSKTLVIHPATTIFHDCSPEQQLAAGVTEDLIRISIGLEHSDDLKQDFLQALQQVH